MSKTNKYLNMPRYSNCLTALTFVYLCQSSVPLLSNLNVFNICFADRQIRTVSQRHLQSTLDGNTTQSLRLVLRLSTSEGVRTMYDAFVDRKTHQVGLIKYNLHC